MLFLEAGTRLAIALSGLVLLIKYRAIGRFFWEHRNLKGSVLDYMLFPTINAVVIGALLLTGGLGNLYEVIEKIFETN